MGPMVQGSKSPRAQGARAQEPKDPRAQGPKWPGCLGKSRSKNYNPAPSVALKKLQQQQQSKIYVFSSSLRVINNN
jgi:hypothetical protein